MFSQDEIAFAVEASKATEVTLEAVRPLWWDSIEARLAVLRQLPQDWNGYGAAPLNADTVNRAAGVLASLTDHSTPEPSIVPAVRGGVQIEWHTMVGDLEIEFRPSGGTQVLFSEATTGQDTELDDVSLEALRQFVRSLTP